MPDTIHGFADGDEVIDTRTGSVGRVRFRELTEAERASGECAEAEIGWYDSFVAEELDEVTVLHLKVRG